MRSSGAGYWVYVAASIAMMALGLDVMATRFKSRRSLDSISGTVTYLSDHWQDLPSTHPGKFRYIAVDTYPYVIEMFIGKAPGDYSPASEQVDSLKVGQRVLIYYDRSSDDDIRETHINRSAQFIERDGIVYFERGNQDIYVGGFLVALSGLLLCFLIYVRQKGWAT
jgi:hypothetical protein